METQVKLYCPRCGGGHFGNVQVMFWRSGWMRREHRAYCLDCGLITMIRIKPHWLKT